MGVETINSFLSKQESIPVGCVPPASWQRGAAIQEMLSRGCCRGGGGVCCPRRRECWRWVLSITGSDIITHPLSVDTDRCKNIILLQTSIVVGKNPFEFINKSLSLYLAAIAVVDTVVLLIGKCTSTFHKFLFTFFNIGGHQPFYWVTVTTDSGYISPGF